MLSIFLISSHGLGDCILGLQCSYFIPKNEETELHIAISARDEVFLPLKHIFGKTINFFQIDAKYGENNAILTNTELLNELIDVEMYDEIYYVVPDLLFRNKYAFDYKKYNTHPQIIKSTRLLADKRDKTEKIIYCGLNTTTKGYFYSQTKELLIQLSKLLPDYTIYYPNIQNWNNELTNNIILNDDLRKIYPNIQIDENSDFFSSLDILKKSEYFIGTCNGPSHIAYQFGIPRLILDPQFERYPWISRWKNDYLECISNQNNFVDVGELVITNVKESQTCLIPRQKVLQNLGEDWSKLLLYKEL